MNKVKNFTTTLSLSILESLDEVSKSLSISKNDILSSAFLEWNKKFKQDQLKKSYQKSSLDKEWVELGEGDILEWEKQIKSWEK